MKIAYVHANFWPYVRRGVERFTYELAQFMSCRGHSVDVITTKPGPSRIGQYGDVRVIYQRQMRHPLLQKWRYGYLYNVLFGVTALKPLLAGNYDLIHCWFYTYAPASILAAQKSRGKMVYHNIVYPPHYDHPVDQAVFRQSIARANGVAVLSELAASQIQKEFGIESRVLPPPVNLASFKVADQKELAAPRILFASSLTDSKKGLPWLLQAFSYVRKRSPKARLQLAGPEEWFRVEDHFDRYLDPPELRDAVEVLGAGTLESLSRLYSEAAVTVLPSLREPFGMVLIESLAAGTPVVGTRGGGPQEIITPEVGTLVDLDSLDEMTQQAKVAELGEAILRSIALNRNPDTAMACRERASLWSVETIGARTETYYGELA